MNENNWRIRNQESYLLGAQLTKKSYQPYRSNWDHDHCEFCHVKFSETIEGCETEGWATEDNYYWVCSNCYKDFKSRFRWK